ncbi:MAG TPA: energy transducer TonB, partial [Caulobacteraceae bacterium]|nr:energy transducer TonB [Caulobacteraceae bacterium]
PAPTKAAAAVAKPQPARPAFDLDALQASIAKAARSAPSKPAFAARRGPTRAETAPQARIDAGAGVSQSSMQGLQQLLQRLWNPNCNVEGGGAVIVPVRFGIGDDGRVVGRVTAGGQDGAPVVAAAARRAIDAVHEAEPYGPEYRGASFKVIFDARKACAQ